MDAKERLYDASTQQFDKCVDRSLQKMKNCLWGTICHAYNEGVKDGRKEHDEQAYKIGAEDMLDVIRDFLLTSRERPSYFAYEEIREVMNVSHNYTVDILSLDAETLMEKAKEITRKREVESFQKQEKLKECDTVEYALDTLKKHGWKQQEYSCKSCPFLGLKNKE